jgi:hypothetical protein
MKRVLAVLNEPRTIYAYVTYARFIAETVAADVIFVAPRPPSADLLADIAALQQATVASLSRTFGTKAKRMQLTARVHQGLMTLRCYVQEVADASPGEQAAVIARAGMSVKNARGPSKAGFAAKQGPVSGAVLLSARAERTRASYEWQYSLDQKTWLSSPPTVRADTTLRGFIPGTRVFFRYRPVTKAGVSDWSDVVSLVVV